ncbi:phage portal protein [Streptomyces albidoflavus]|uniref:phage portal protein n=2 Tax=Streptomyces albidoflavus TaxID=1886 RepID=UPI000BAE4A92|nr:phage portal protein [Streptomyces albidoflavus]PAX85588.1 phage portal protein [Streptomyces albidoflavus]PBO17712.1 phage portal protein [Streptomyces albidoflavus]PBO23033.1 phage portal protein [Streptomyces albidoflavus]
MESPEWWLDRLYDQLQARIDYVARMRSYCSGNHPLPTLPDKARSAFQKLLRHARSNYVGLVADATSERIQVDGFRLGGAEVGDEELWRIWQANSMDADSDMLIGEAVRVGRSFALVAPNPEDPATPLITAEDATQAIVAYRPGSRRVRAAGLKCWLDDWGGLLMATLYLPDAVYKYEAPAPKAGSAGKPKWTARQVDGEAWPAPNPLGLVSLVELPNRPDLLGEAHSEIEDVLDIQDRINKTLIDRLMAQEFSAFRQRWATGYELPEDEQGQPVEPFRSAVDRLWVAEDSAVKFGEFGATDLTPYLKAAEADVQHMAARTRTPAQYLLGQLSNVNGETLKASESGLVSKVRQRQRPLGEGMEEVARLALRAAGSDRDLSRIETIWRNPEFRTEGELVDALVKMSTLGVPQEALWERWGASQTEIAQWSQLRNQAATRVMGGDMAALYGPKPDGGDVDGNAE